MAVLSKLSSSDKNKARKSSLFSTLKSYFLCSTSCKDDDKHPDPLDHEEDNVSVISLSNTRQSAQPTGSSDPSLSLPTSLSAMSSTNTLSLSDTNRITRRVIGNRILPFEAFVTPVDSVEQVSGKETLPPLDPVHSKKTHSYIGRVLHWRSHSKKNRPIHIIVKKPVSNDNTSQIDVEAFVTPVDSVEQVSGKETLPPLDPVHSKKTQSYIGRVLRWRSRSKKNRPKHIIVKKPVSNDNTSQNDVEKKICIEPEPIPIMVAEAPIENRVPFQSSVMSTSQSTSSSPMLIKVTPAPVTKQVSFQLPPTTKTTRNLLDPVLLSEAMSDFPSHSWAASTAIRQFGLSSNRTAVPKEHQDIQKPRDTQEVLERPRGAHHARIRSRTMKVQEYIPYDQEYDADSEDEGGKVTGLPRPRTRRGKRNSEIIGQ